MNQKPVYLDNNSTTRTDPRVVEAMLPYFDAHYGNPSSTSHIYGWTAREAVENAVAEIAGHLGAEPREIVITSGATESINLALKGVAPFLKKRGNHIITCLAEHKAGIDTVKRLTKDGWDVTWLKPDATGMVSPELVESALTDQTSLVSIMHANNEVGTINPIRDIATICHQQNIVVHADATQTVGKLIVNVDDLGVDLMSFSAHKFHGPKGIGGLYVRRRERPVRLVPLIEGGGHQRGLRSGTMPVPLIVGMARALSLCMDSMLETGSRQVRLLSAFMDSIQKRLSGVHLNGHPTLRLPNTLNLRFDSISGEALMLAMKNVAVSSGSACSSEDPEPSHVLRSMGLTDDQARSSIRFSLSRFTTEDELQVVLESLVSTVNALRQAIQKSD